MYKVRISKYKTDENMFTINLYKNEDENYKIHVDGETLKNIKLAIIRKQKQKEEQNKMYSEKYIDGDKFKIVDEVLIYYYIYKYPLKSVKRISRKIPLNKLKDQTLASLPKNILEGITNYISEENLSEKYLQLINSIKHYMDKPQKEQSDSFTEESDENEPSEDTTPDNINLTIQA